MIKKIIGEYNGEEFEIKIGEKYEFSDYNNFKHVFVGKLLSIGSNTGVFKTLSDSYNFIRPIQKPKPLTSAELYRLCGKYGYEVKFSNDSYGILHCVNEFLSDEITHFRKAYSQDEWKPISEIKRE